jgi:adenine-specific DNA-methyltransferase
LGRVVFLYFLQKKGWLGCPVDAADGGGDWNDGDRNFIKNLFVNFTDKQHFYSHCLTKLFFETLNTKRENDVFVIPNAHPLDGQNPAAVKVPYLNGGLFDNDLPQSNGLDFPENYFADLFDFFDQYNFTIDENSPDDAEVGIDPEMLGHIFENLLEENKDKGAFYTPKAIVQYMCQESLIAYLTTQLALNNNDRASAIEAFVRHNDFDHRNRKDYIVQNAKRIEILLDNVKVCDPAIGSGAFPMGMLQEIFKAKMALDLTLEPAEVKRHIIQNSIYGVDLERGAVDIARLRFWLALVVDEDRPSPLPNLDYKIMQGNSLLESFEGVPLHNLQNTKTALTLVEGGQQLDMFGNRVAQQTRMEFLENKQQDLNDLIDTFFDMTDATQKQSIKRNINDIVHEHLRYNVNITLKDIIDEIATLNDEIVLVKINDNDPKAKKEQKQKAIANKQKAVENLHKEQTRLQNALLTLERIQETNERPYFLWHLYFKDAFENGGFDIVIGNPPYVKEYTNKSAFENIPYYQGKMDLWYSFACHGIDLLKQNGLLAFIATNNWVSNTGASVMRDKITNDAKIKQMIDFGSYMIFENASIQTMIMVFEKTNQNNSYLLDYRKLAGDKTTLSDVIDLLEYNSTEKTHFLTPNFQKQNFINKSLLFSNDTSEKILQLIKSKGNFILNENSEIAQGIVLPQDSINKKSEFILGDDFKVGQGVFVLSNEEKEGLRLNAEENDLVKPYFTTRQLHRWCGSSENDEWIIYTDSKFKKADSINPYPNIKKHLDQFQAIITSDNKPYGLHRAREEYFFKGEKIIVLRKCSGLPTFTYTDFDCYVSATFYVIKTERVNQKYLTALLNSKLIAFWLRNKGKMQGNNYQLDKEPLLQIPIPQISFEAQQPFVALVDAILVGSNVEKTALEAKIDTLVYELYGLTEAEIEQINQ